jgi:hypothetical protein
MSEAKWWSNHGKNSVYFSVVGVIGGIIIIYLAIT